MRPGESGVLGFQQSQMRKERAPGACIVLRAVRGSAVSRGPQEAGLPSSPVASPGPHCRPSGVPRPLRAAPPESHPDFASVLLPPCPAGICFGICLPWQAVSNSSAHPWHRGQCLAHRRPRTTVWGKKRGGEGRAGGEVRACLQAGDTVRVWGAGLQTPPGFGPGRLGLVAGKVGRVMDGLGAGSVGTQGGCRHTRGG